MFGVAICTIFVLLINNNNTTMKQITIISSLLVDGTNLACLPFELEQYQTDATVHMVINMKQLYQLVYNSSVKGIELVEYDEVSDGIKNLLNRDDCYSESGHHPDKGDYWTELDEAGKYTEYYIHFGDGTKISVYHDDNHDCYGINDLLFSKSLRGYQMCIFVV